MIHTKLDIDTYGERERERAMRIDDGNDSAMCRF